MPEPKSKDRRDFLANLALAVTVIPGLGILARQVSSYVVPGGTEPFREVLLGKLSELPIAASRFVKNVLGNDLIVIRLSEEQVRVFSSTCTHLGCRVEWDQVNGNFLCPCHMGRFNTEGQVIAGPPPEPLPSYEVRLEGDHMWATVPDREA